MKYTYTLAAFVAFTACNDFVSAAGTCGEAFTVQSGDSCWSIVNTLSKKCASIAYIGGCNCNTPVCSWVNGAWAQVGNLRAGDVDCWRCN